MAAYIATTDMTLDEKLSWRGGLKQIRQEYEIEMQRARQAEPSASGG